MAGLGPMAGQNHHFGSYAPEPIPYAIDRYVNETGRLYAVLDKQLRGPRVHRRRLLDRRHRVLSVDPAGAAAAEHRRLSRPQALEGGDRRASRDAARVRDREDDQREAGDQRRGIAQDPVRAGAAHRALKRARHRARRHVRRPLQPNAERPSRSARTFATIRKPRRRAQRLDDRHLAFGEIRRAQRAHGTDCRG